LEFNSSLTPKVIVISRQRREENKREKSRVQMQFLAHSY
jgi:hypothetical protein